jgi:transaldolase/glucose-6-phosphate isomerase
VNGTKLHELTELGQSIWLDYIRRSLIESGRLREYVDMGLRGMTSNPSIFEAAIAHTDSYDQDLRRLANAGKSVKEIYEALAVADIQRAADILRPVYEQSEGADGFVSLEVDPRLAHQAQKTIDEVQRLAAVVDRPNVMIKVPATVEGIPVVKALIGQGYNINVTLMFSLEQYDAVADAYISGLEQRLEDGGDLRGIASVASFFVSRIDVKVDRMLEELDPPMAQGLKGKIGIASAKLAYERFQETFQGERWQRLADRGARVQRVLYGSTSTKNPDYPDTLYVDNLIGPQTVNTVPPETLKAFLDHGTVARTLDQDVDEAHAALEQLDALGISIKAVTRELLVEGVDKFVRPFDSLLETIAEERERLGGSGPGVKAHIAFYEDVVDDALQDMKQKEIVDRIWSRDHTVWKPDPAEITNRLGWLDSPVQMRDHVAEIEAFAQGVRDDGFSDVLLLGMGGSSLAPELFSLTFGFQEGYPGLQVLSSTDPGAVLAVSKRLDPARTLFVVSSKSGTTAETRAFFRYFYDWTADALGAERTGEHFVAITDPGSPLSELAARYDFRAVFENNPDIGGRYSALSHFGLVPAALVGVDLSRLLDRALAMRDACGPDGPVSANPAARLGAILGELAKAGRNKATVFASPQIASFGDWVEQLIAESTGKSGTGILPVVREPVGPPEVYADDDRLFVYLYVEGDEGIDKEELAALRRAGHPLVRLRLEDRYDIGAQFFLWEMATAIAGQRLGIHPFNQPNVESSKQRTRETLAAYKESGALPSESPRLSVPGITVYSDLEMHDLEEALSVFLGQASPGDYIVLQAYVQPSGETTAELQRLRLMLRDDYHLATTFGYGPRFLHSTGQLHKGDAGNGLFIQFTSDHPLDVPIPDEPGSTASSLTFGTMILAQAMGDWRALRDAGRRVIRFHLGERVVGGLLQLIDAVD